MRPARVTPPGEDHQIHIPVGLDERVVESQRVRGVHVVVELAVQEQQPTLQPVGEIKAGLVRLVSVTDQALVLLAPVGDVAAKVIHPRAGHADGEDVGPRQHGVHRRSGPR